MGPVGSLDQNGFRFRNDDGNETTATWKAALNTNVVFDTVDLDANFRIRIQTAAVSIKTTTPQLQYSKNSGAWTNVNASSSVVRCFASPNVGDGDATTEQLAGSQVFVAGSFDEVDGLGAATVLNSQDTEHEYCVQVRSVDVVTTDTIDLRVNDNGIDYDAYTVIPRITVTITGGGSTTTTYLLVTAPGANLALCVTDFMISGQTAGTSVTIFEDTTTSLIHRFYIPVSGYVHHVSLRTPKKLGVNKPIYATVTNTVTAFDICVNGYMVPDSADDG